MIPVDLKIPSLTAVRAEAARRSMAKFVTYTKPDYVLEWFHEDVSRELDWFLDEVAAKRSPRLMLFAPPQHGKTELASRRFPARAFGKYPDTRIIAASHTSDWASAINRDVQRIMDDELYLDVYPDSTLYGKNIRTVAKSGSWLRNNDIFEIVGHRGFYRSSGVGVGITGRSADILLIDDPVKDAEQAYSATSRQSVWDWYVTVAHRRVQAGGGILLIMTRWHEDDLAGRLIRLMRENSLADQWRIISYPGIAEQDEKHRKKGEALAPGRYSLDYLLSIKTFGETYFNAMYQQRPSDAEGNIFKRQYVQYIYPGKIEVKHLKQVVLSLDAAVKQKETSDYSCLLEGWEFDLGTLTNGTQTVQLEKGILIKSRIHGRLAYPQLREMTKIKALEVKPSALLVEDKSAGQQVIQELQQTTNLPVKPIQVGIDKTARAWVVLPTWESRQVWFPCDENGVPEPWCAIDQDHDQTNFLTELFAFDKGVHDDQVDALTQLLNYLTLSGGGRGLLGFYQKQLAKEAEQKKADARASNQKVEYVNLLGAIRK